jgi:hypothetical protein
MNKIHLTKIWQWLSIACVLYLSATVISLQGGTEYLGRLFGDHSAGERGNEPGVAYFGAIIGGALLLLASLTLLLHIRRHGQTWHARIPVVWLKGLATGSWEGQFFQICVLVIFIAVPVAGVLRCMEVAEAGDICEQDTTFQYRGSETTLLWAPTGADTNQMRLHNAGSSETGCHGIELFPRTLTPLGFYGLPVAAFSLVLAALGSLFRSPTP